MQPSYTPPAGSTRGSMDGRVKPVKPGHGVEADGPTQTEIALADSRNAVEQKEIMMITRRAFSTALAAGAAAYSITTLCTTVASAPPRARSVVLVHGLFADGSCWSAVIADCRQ
jgi:hypothetical protein